MNKDTIRLHDLKPKHLEALADGHIRLYTTKIDAAEPILNRTETSKLVAMWESIKQKAPRGISALAQEEIDHICNLITDGGSGNILARVLTNVAG